MIINYILSLFLFSINFIGFVLIVYHQIKNYKKYLKDKSFDKIGHFFELTFILLIETFMMVITLNNIIDIYMNISNIIYIIILLTSTILLSLFSKKIYYNLLERWNKK